MQLLYSKIIGMKGKSIVLGLLLAISLTTYSQTIKSDKTPINRQITNSEIDRLCEKYKGVKSITLNTTTEDLQGWIDIDSNNSKKPMSISISGSTANKTAVAEVLVNTIKMKLKQGYHLMKIPIEWAGGQAAVKRLEEKLELAPVFYLSNSFGDGDYAHGIFMVKGNMYFRAGVRKTDRKSPDHYVYDWEIITGDVNREDSKVDKSKKAGKKAFSLDF
jgi:hypothetical protein